MIPVVEEKVKKILSIVFLLKVKSLNSFPFNHKLCLVHESVIKLIKAPVVEKNIRMERCLN